ncbi:hypothetical protein MGLY_00040 [Neomoorella glycerini]|uniref:Uncharacterized protein n=1 Tax=Neomoorella glycerini TaxID=55779 RepID=A0A6I5ZLL1_9FIRM|nr:hypothetical protein [Moorella glycerini]QGP90696.1 hypothetical protein MGLY_00040 [Moorella glycerini]
MALFSKFNFKNLKELKEKIAELKLDIELIEDLRPLARKVKIGSRELPNFPGHPPHGRM